MKIDIKEVSIIKVTIDNYYMYENMVKWRIDGKELSEQEKQKLKNFFQMNPKEELNTDNFFVYAAEYKGRFVGWINMSYIPKLAKWKSGYIYVDELWIAPDFRRNGVALKLLDKAKILKEDFNAICIRLYTSTSNAIKLYEKFGLDIVNECVFMELN